MNPEQPATDAPPPNPKPPAYEHIDGFNVDIEGDEEADRTLATLEMAGEEVAAGWKPRPHEALAPEVRYLHVSRTIHELITDRNRSVGIFLFVASILFGSSTALLNAPERVEAIIPLKTIQYWCLPLTSGILAILGVFVSLILIRTRIGLIFEVAKMNALLGLPSDRVQRVNPLSIFFLMHLLVALLGAASAGATVGMIAYHEHVRGSLAVLVGIGVGVLYLAVFMTGYYWTILQATTQTKLQNAKA